MMQEELISELLIELRPNDKNAWNHIGKDVKTGYQLNGIIGDSTLGVLTTRKTRSLKGCLDV